MTDQTYRERPLWLTVFGPVRAWRDGAEVDLGPPQQRAMLALLLGRCGAPVPLGELAGALWPEGGPASAAGILHRYASQLRRILEPSKEARAAGSWISRSSAGYCLTVAADEADVALFRSLSGAGAGLDDLLAACEVAGEPVAAGAAAHVRGHSALKALENDRVAALLAAADLALAGDAAVRVIPLLRAFAADRPQDEAIR